MTNTPRFTADELRALAARFRPLYQRRGEAHDRMCRTVMNGINPCDCRALNLTPDYRTMEALDAFAQRLERDESGPAIRFTKAYMVGPKADVDVYEESLREEGRREVLKEIAALKCDSVSGDMGACNFCDPDIMSSEAHRTNCLWLRAQQVTNSQPPSTVKE